MYIQWIQTVGSVCQRVLFIDQFSLVCKTELRRTLLFVTTKLSISTVIRATPVKQNSERNNEVKTIGNIFHCHHLGFFAGEAQPVKFIHHVAKNMEFVLTYWGMHGI